jgi:hypothetical protein
MEGGIVNKVIVRDFVLAGIVSLLCFMPGVLIAENNEAEYMVKKDDTLWDISTEKLKDPFLWKELWKENKEQIKNPDLIFPGQKLRIPHEVAVEKKPVGILSQQIKKAGRKITSDKMLPEGIPAHKTGPIISPETLIISGAIIDKVPGIGRISGSPRGKTILVQGDFVYILADIPTAKGGKFYVFEGPRTIVHPVTDRFVGYFMRVKGIVEIVGEEAGNKKAVVVKSFDDIDIGDLLGEYYPVIPIELAERKPDGIRGYVVMINNNRLMASEGNIVYLDRGAGDGVAVGDLFDVTSGEKPNIQLGVIQVISVRDRTSTALIKASTDAIRPGDSFGNKNN